MAPFQAMSWRKEYCNAAGPPPSISRDGRCILRPSRSGWLASLGSPHSVEASSRQRMRTHSASLSRCRGHLELLGTSPSSFQAIFEATAEAVANLPSRRRGQTRAGAHAEAVDKHCALLDRAHSRSVTSRKTAFLIPSTPSWSPSTCW